MRWFKDPLVAFLAAGAVIFYLAGLFTEDEISYQVEVRDQDVARITDQWTMQMRRPPTEVELAGLIEQFVKEEIYYREARRLGLDANDTIVRRRMVQKLTFLTEDIATAAPIDESALRDFYEEHKETYRVPERYSFRHRYFSADKRANAKADATAALTDLNAAGDPFMLQREYALRSAREIGDLFGRNFAEQLTQLQPAEKWQGPVQSAYGWHAVLVTDRAPTSLPDFDAVRERVAIDAQQATRREANEAYYEDLKARYTITYPGAE